MPSTELKPAITPDNTKAVKLDPSYPALYRDYDQAEPASGDVDGSMSPAPETSTTLGTDTSKSAQEAQSVRFSQVLKIIQRPVTAEGAQEKALATLRISS